MKINQFNNYIKSFAGLAILAASYSVFAGGDMVASLAVEKTAGYEQEVSRPKPDFQKIEPISIMGSIKPVALMIEAVIPRAYRDAWDIKVLVPPQSTEHDYQLKPSDVVKMQSAEKLFWLGKGAEPAFAKSVERFSVNSAPFTSAQLPWLLVKADEMELAHQGHNHEPGSLDPHIWLSLPDTPKMLTYIAEELLQTLSDESLLRQKGWTLEQIAAQKTGIRQGLQQALSEQKRLMQNIESLKKTSWTNTKYISFHNAFAYLDDAFGVKSLGAFVQNPEDGIAPRQLQLLQEVIKDEDLGCLILEPSADGRRIGSFIPDHFKVVDLDILGTSLPEGVDWSGYWKYVTEQLQACFSSPALDRSAGAEKRSVHEEKEVSREKEERILDKLKFFE